jgi:hypothetical protein
MARTDQCLTSRLIKYLCGTATITSAQPTNMLLENIEYKKCQEGCPLSFVTNGDGDTGAAVVTVRCGLSPLAAPSPTFPAARCTGRPEPCTRCADEVAARWRRSRRGAFLSVEHRAFFLGVTVERRGGTEHAWRGAAAGTHRSHPLSR